MVKMRVSTANLFTSNPTDLIFSYGKRNIICVKEDCFAIPKFLTGTFLNAVLGEIRTHPLKAWSN